MTFLLSQPVEPSGAMGARCPVCTAPSLAVEGVRIIGCANRVDASETTRQLGVTARPLAESLQDTVRWLVEAGHVSAKQAGKAAP